MKIFAKKLTLLFIVSLFVFVSSAYVVEYNPKVNGLDFQAPFYDMEFDGTYDWEVNPDNVQDNEDYIPYDDLRTNYIIPIQNGTESISNLLSYVNSKFIRIDTANDLYHFSRDVSFIEQFTTYNPSEEIYEINSSIDQSLVTTLLGLDYVLGQDIDYAEMQSKSFDPIGYDFTFQGTTYTNHFTGTFNGQGFEIDNLYISGFERIALVSNVGELIIFPISEYYAMFNNNQGDIRNLGLIDPNLEILQVSDDLTKLANIVGENNGTIDHVYVIDNRESVTEAGIRYRVGNTPKIFSAAGIVHTNKGNLSNAYFSSKVVVNGNYINKFDLEPIVFDNQSPGTTSHIVYDIDRYLINVTVGSSTFTINTPSQGLGETTVLMKSDQSSLNTGDWYFYPDDGYPILQGMTYSSGYYMIEDAKDLAFFPELLSFSTEMNSLNFSDANYKLMSNIDMGILANGIYKTPMVTFNGEFIGTNDSAIDQSDHYYIYNLHQTDFLGINSKVYAGLFSVLGNGSLVKDLNIIRSSIAIDETNDFYSFDVFVGGIAGEMIAATIEDVYIDMDIDLGQDALGSIHLGGLVGRASGLIQRVSSHGFLNVNNHSYTPTTSPIKGEHYIGGIVGKAANAKLVLDEVANRGDISSFDTSSSITLVSGSNLNVYTGGIIGYLDYNDLYMPEFSDIVNSGDITLNSVANPANNSGIQYMGGLIGLLEGDAPLLEDNGDILFANFINQGQVNYDYDSSSIEVYASGILNANLIESYELALLKNYGSFSYDSTGASFTDFTYAGIINDLGNDDFTLSRVYQYGQQVYDSSVYEKTYGMVTSLNNNNILLRYSANYGDVLFMDNNGDTSINLNNDLKISAITEEDNVDYLNVHNYGDISVVNVNAGSNDIYIAGFSSQLSENKILKNSLNAGDIVFADISGSGLVFVGGFVNTNFSGDLENFTLNAVQPIATQGILNSMNYGNISTTYNSAKYGVDGTNNTLVGGLVTLNKKSIQDSANLGDISVVNTNPSAVSTFYNSSNDIDQYFAGLIQSYTGGVVAGGVAAMAIDGDSRIYDSSNSGDVLVLTERFSRAGGVLGVSLYEESTGAGIDASMGLVDTIELSVLSNGLNFGNISAITREIELYSTTPITASTTLIVGTQPDPDNVNVSAFNNPYRQVPYTYSDTSGSNERIPIHAAAGGVIGYGLSMMRNMLNHGTISSTDVAGGIVGATYVLGGVDFPTTLINIETAVNYGDIKSIESDTLNPGSIPSSLEYNLSEDQLAYMSDGNTFIFPSVYLREAPQSKRGFGGVFGRLQRGNRGTMTPNGTFANGEQGAFNFIVNANPNIDLIGRLDQVGLDGQGNDFSNTVTAYQFNGAIYYSARENDTTQTVFAGFIYTSSGTVTDVEYTGYTSVYNTGFLWFVWYDYYFTYDITIESDSFSVQQGIESSSTSHPTIITTFEEEILIEFRRSVPNVPNSSYTVGETTTEANAFVKSVDIPWITEDPNDPLLTDPNTEYMYDEDFEMRTNPALTEYIYYAEANLLADRFQTGGANPRPNGMYVLATSAGQTFGSVLPRNIDRQAIEIIDESLDMPLSQDYNQVNDFRLDLDTNIIDAYNGLRQTAYSDQANLIDDDINQEFILQETSGSNNTLIANDISNYLGTGVDLGIDYSNNVITMAISMESFDPSQTSASFDILSALTSANALIGIRAEEYPLMNDLIFSEYVEGTDGNSDNALEIYNGTGSTVDLSNYSIEIYRSGSTSLGTAIPLSGTLEPGETHVIVNDAARQEMLDLADQIEIMRYNGDDTIFLVNGSTRIDVFGLFGNDPGVEWTWSGGGSSANSTSRRSVSTLNPSTTWDTSQWIPYPADTVDGLGEHTVYLPALSDELYAERYNGIVTTPNIKANLNIDLPNHNITSSTLETLGWFSTYSEAFYMDSLNGTYEFNSNQYYNNYRIDILFLPNLSQSPNTTGIDSVAFNGGGNINVSTASSIDIRTTGDVNFDGSLSLNFIDQNNILVPGYDFSDNFELYYNDGSLVTDDYYTVSSVPVDASGNYSITFDISQEIRSGDYYLEYSYFPSSTTYRVDFDKSPSPNANIIDFTYITENNSVPDPITTDFDSFIDIGQPLDIDSSNTHITENISGVSYLADTYDISYMIESSLKLSPFARVISAIKTGETYANGYLVHQLQYIIEAEDGTQVTYTHEIFERNIEIELVEKNSNIVPIDDVFASREAIQTQFTIDLGFDQSLNDGVNFYGDPNTVFVIDVVDDLGNPMTYQGITWTFAEFLNIKMTIDTEPGDYYFSITYIGGGRNVEIKTPLGNDLLIVKNQGVNAYLSDIRFSEFANETNYPDISVYNPPGQIDGGTINNTYNPQAYFNGFDYDGSKIANEQYFRIDGEVSNVPLDDYQPIFDGFVPLGATIERGVWNGSGWDYVSDLATDFTLDPKTGLEPGFNDDKVTIRYRVTSENGLNVVYYDISVTDVIFNVTFLFDIYYCSNGLEGSCVLAKDSIEFNQELVIINVQNLITDGQKGLVDDDPVNYPAFTQVNGIENKTIQFYYTDSPNYTYRFARNKSHFYNFAVELPLDQYLNDIYDYEIEFEIGTNLYYLNDASDYVPGLQGKYFYIQDSVNLRTRRFNIYIFPKENPETDKPFGLFDFFKTWS